MKKKIFVRGPVLSQSGYGEQSRFALRALRSREDLFDIYIQPINWGQTGWVWEDNEFRQWMDEKIKVTQTLLQAKQLQPDISLQITIPNEFQKLCPINIGYTAGIETTKVAPQWLQKGNDMDKILVVSQHAKDSYVNTVAQAQNKQTGEVIPYRLETPVEVVWENTPLETENEPIDGFEPRHDFNFLCVSQFGPRKNLENTIRWFVDEFKDKEVGLILKTNIKANCRIDKEHVEKTLKAILAPYKERKCSVSLLHGDLSNKQMRALYTHDKVKAMINISHGEGFGLPLFEAARYGLPIVAVGWSGQLDFLEKSENQYYTKVSHELNNVQQQAVWDGVIQADSQWAFANEGSYKTAIRVLHDKYEAFKDSSTKLQSVIEENFSDEVLFKGFCDAIFKEEEESPGVEMEDIPKISLITSVFDASEHIEQLMEDVTRQTIFEDKCEWIILNANPEGNDFEEEVIKKYVEKYPNNIVYKRLEDDPGIYAVWNKAIELSTGHFVTNINCDDRRATDCLEKQAKLLVANSDVDLVYTDSYIVHEPNVKWEDIKPDTSRYNFEQFSKEAILRGNLPHNNPMWRKNLHDIFGYFREDYKSASDWEFWLRCVFGGSKFKKSKDVLGVYYFNPRGMSTDKENEDWKRKEEKEVFKTYIQMIGEQ
jgi:glycosyltransferase involved in cell wall biosynthesis